jgi:hypothetical protein
MIGNKSANDHLGNMADRPAPPHDSAMRMTRAEDRKRTTPAEPAATAPGARQFLTGNTTTQGARGWWQSRAGPGDWSGIAELEDEMPIASPKDKEGLRLVPGT